MTLRDPLPLPHWRVRPASEDPFFLAQVVEKDAHRASAPAPTFVPQPI